MFKAIGVSIVIFALGAVFIAAKPVDNSPSSNNFAADINIDSIVVNKASHKLIVFCNQQAIKVYRIHLGLCPNGPKQCEGDYKTPEGLYIINSKNATSKFHKSLGISYPNEQDIARAQQLGKRPGGDILIHGLPNGEENAGPKRYQNDWTWGCVALSNFEIDELFLHVKTGTPILITP
jgi:murein L,D-transpeptidase YafK